MHKNSVHPNKTIKFIRTSPYPSINQSQISDKAITLQFLIIFVGENFIPANPLVTPIQAKKF